MATTCTDHGVFFRGFCTWCGQKVEEEYDGAAGVAFDYVTEGLRIADWKADNLRKENTVRLVHEKKLVLILDLDHTLLQSITTEDRLWNREDFLLKVFNYWEEDQSNAESLFLLESFGGMLTKLRPFVREFLQEARQMFDMYVYTMGTREYAMEMTKLLDPPEGTLFENKVISRKDCSTNGQKGLDVVLAEEGMVVIVDDTRSAWARHERNLIQIEKYNFFGSSRLGDGESGAYVVLEQILCVLKQMHTMFFDPGLGTGVEPLSRRDTRHLLDFYR